MTYCECGCGELAGIANATVKSRGWVKGKPRRFLRGHQSRVLQRARRDARERFWEKVKKVEGGCWLWTASTNKGYGLFREFPGLRMEMTHRISYRWAKGEIPEGAVVMHSCDNKRCVNPEHLSVGPQSENVRQAVERNLVRRGEQKPLHKLSDLAVSEIRRRAANGESGNRLAMEFGVSSPTIQAIVHRRKWRHVA